MKRGIVSATYLKMFLQCRLKFFFRYHTDKTPIITGNARAFGIALHSALEEMYKRLGSTKKIPSAEDYDYVYTVFIKQCINNNLDDFALIEEGKLILKTRLDAYDPSEKVLGLELRFGFPYGNPTIPAVTAGGTHLTGAIDKLTELDKDTIVILDYKSSHTALTEDEAATDEQLSLYDLVVSKLYPQYKNIIMVLDYLRLKPVITHRTEEQRALFEKFVDETAAVINSLEEKDCKPNINGLCGWCDYRHYCDAYAKIINDPGLKLKPAEALTEEELVAEWSRFDSVSKSVDAYHRDLKMRAADLVRDKAKATLVGKDITLYRIQNSRVTYDIPTVMRLIPQKDLVNLISVNKSGIDKYLVDHPEHTDDIASTASVSFAASFFKQKKTPKK